MKKNIPIFHIYRMIEGWPINIQGTQKGIVRIQFGKFRNNRIIDTPLPDWVDKAFHQLTQYFQGKRKSFRLPLENPVGTPFQRQIWKLCSEIPYGRVATYGELARKAGSPGGTRAVGQALGKNPLPLIVPCHRVVGSDGKLTGFSAGIQWKQKLLDLEKASPDFWHWPT